MQEKPQTEPQETLKLLQIGLPATKQPANKRSKPLENKLPETLKLPQIKLPESKRPESKQLETPERPKWRRSKPHESKLPETPQKQPKQRWLLTQKLGRKLKHKRSLIGR
jgi:hypothetical protein